ncbi:MAG: hypothetical protein ACKOGP_06270, partial [Bacteroidota bacterium]
MLYPIKKKTAVLVFALFSCLLFGSFSYKSDPSIEIRVVVNGIKPVTGNVGLLLFKAKEGFPGKMEKSVMQGKIM